MEAAEHPRGAIHSRAATFSRGRNLYSRLRSRTRYQLICGSRLLSFVEHRSLVRHLLRCERCRSQATSSFRPGLCAPEHVCIGARQATELPIGLQVVEIKGVDKASGEIILDELEHILIQFGLRARRRAMLARQLKPSI